jgi:hypothetical protein
MNEHEYMHDLYKSGKAFGRTAKLLRYSARQMFDKADIANNLNKAKKLRALYDYLRTQKGGAPLEQMERWSIPFEALNDCFSVILDDLMLLSAYEMYAKAFLISKGYVVHEIEIPQSLKRLQKKGPIHVRTIRAKMASGEVVKFQETTIGIGHLLSSGYKAKVKTPKLVEDGLIEARNRRNRIHFALSYTWSVTPQLLALVEYLDKEIPKSK